MAEPTLGSKPVKAPPREMPLEMPVAMPRSGSLVPIANVDDMERRLLVFRRIAAPLMAAIESTPPADGMPRTLEQVATQFAELIDSTIDLNRSVARMLGVDAGDGRSRWLATSAATEIVAAHYRATTSTLANGEAMHIVGAMHDAVVKILAELAPPSTEPKHNESVVGRSVKALAPVITAITRFSFGRDPTELLGEIAERLTTIASEIAGKLGSAEPVEDATDTVSPLYYAVLEVAGEFYMESHFAERDRLLEMAPEERKAYVQAHNRKIPMEPVWEGLALRMGMLEALTAYLPGMATP